MKALNKNYKSNNLARKGQNIIGTLLFLLGKSERSNLSEKTSLF